MNDKLETYIADNREDFDILEPSDAIWNKIDAKLNKKNVIRINWRKVMAQAAAVIIIFSISWVVQRQYFSPEKTLQVEQIPAVAEVETFYQTEFENKLQEVKKVMVSYPEIETGMNRDLADLDSTYVSLKEDLKDGMANEEIVAAMIQNYKLKIQILEDLLYKIQKNYTKKGKKQSNDKKHYKL